MQTLAKHVLGMQLMPPRVERASEKALQTRRLEEKPTKSHGNGNVLR